MNLCERNAVAGNPVDGVKRPTANGNEGSTPALGDAQARRCPVRLARFDQGTFRGEPVHYVTPVRAVRDGRDPPAARIAQLPGLHWA